MSESTNQYLTNVAQREKDKSELREYMLEEIMKPDVRDPPLTEHDVLDSMNKYLKQKNNNNSSITQPKTKSEL